MKPPAWKKRRLPDTDSGRFAVQDDSASSEDTLINSQVTTVESYEVEKILSHKRDKTSNNVIAFQIKWKNYPESEATWEPIANLNCPAILSEYWETVYSGERQGSTGLSKEMAKCVERMLGADLLAAGAEIIRFRSSGDGINADFTFRLNLDEYKRRLQTELKAWEQKICQICKEGNEAEIKIENTVDLEGVPAAFTYITNYKAGEGVVIPREAPVGCHCERGQCHGKGNNRKQCCPAMAMGRVEFAYDSHGKVNEVDIRRPIYECNSKCTCGPDCRNRVVQYGRKVPLTIYRTKDKGWGVRTQRRVPARTFVTEYVGEVISDKEAEERGKGYDAEGATYLFDLDFDDSPHVDYAVDAKHYGNVSHFINHSCDPNLQIRAVWIECLDPKMPRLAFFSRRTIEKDEELTFNYRMHDSENTEFVESSEKESKVRISCHCDAANCTGYLN